MKKITILIVAVLILGTSQFANAEDSYVLSEGWNLVSYPVVGYLYQADFFNHGGTMFTLNPIDKQYYGGSGQDNIQKSFGTLVSLSHEDYLGSDFLDDDYFPVYGFWVYSEEKLNIPTLSESEDQKSLVKMYSLFKGWNLIGISSVMVNRSFSDMSGSCKFASVYSFENGGWHKQTDADIKEKFTTYSLGHALAVKVENDCRLNFGLNKSTPSVSSLPN